MRASGSAGTGPAALLLLLLAAGAAAAGAGSAGGGVRVLRPAGVRESADEWVVEAGTEVSLDCRGPGPLAWLFPGSERAEELPPDGATTVAGADGDGPHQQVLQQCRREEGGAHRCVLRLPGAQRHLTGYYSCALRDQPKRNDSVYIYVRDPIDLFVAATGFLHLPVEEGGEALIDCRVNDPRASVSLLKDDRPVEESQQFRDLGMRLRWDKRRGFSLQPVFSAGDWMLECNAVSPSAVESLIVMLSVTRRVEYLPLPRVAFAGPLQFAVEGGNTTLTCRACAEAAVFDMSWQWPQPGPPPSRLVEGEAPVTSNTRLERCGQKNLTLVDARPSDAGTYSCVVEVTGVQSNNSLQLEVVDRNKPFISFSTEPVIAQERDLHAQWVVDVKAYPLPTLQWFNARGEPISSNAKYEVNVTQARTRTSLRISSVDLADRGTYVLQANNGAVEERLNLTLVVFAGPAADLQLPVEVVANGSRVRARCRATGFPRPDVNWAWRRCRDLLQNCSTDADFEDISHTAYSQDVRSDTEVRSELYFAPNASMFVSCLASNNISYSNDTQSLQITDLPVAQRALVTWGPNGTVVVGDPLELWCGALRENYTAPPVWFRQFNESSLQRLHYVSNNSTLSMRAGLQFGRVSFNDSATYVCRVDDTDADSVFYTLTVKNPVAPFLRTASFEDTEVVVPGDQTLTLRCVFGGVPEPNTTWLKGGRPVNVSGRPGARRVSLQEGGRVLHLSYVTEADEGEYTCRGSSRIGHEERSVSLVLEGKKGSALLVIITSLVAVVLVLLVVPLAVWVYKERKLRQDMVVAGLHNFEEGAVASLNPELPADEQAELLPYDRKWEFPRERLKLGKQLGAGAFGVVLKAEAQGLVEGDDWTTVAVKMVKRSADFTYLKALASELKIMVHLGRHLNVVNLLGACTSNLSRRELLVIVEYCRFGNLHNYLLRHREGFIDQVDPATGTIDAAIGAEELARANSMGGRGRVKYASLSFSGSTEETSAGSGSGSTEAGVDYRTAAAAAGCDSGGEAVCMSPTGGEEVALTSSGSAQPEWRSNYRGDYRGRVRPICTRDLLCWAYQVARGMQYLAQRKVLHGDLAARNILLTDGNIVKICDFGLAKSMYKSDNYRKKGDGPLPVKWMALESIRDRIFSTQSDVWSFGIVLWELFSLAQTPYPGMPADEKLYHKLLDGYRMERPPHATHELYRVMTWCWETRPVRRPTFEELAERLGDFLDESMRKHYLELDNAYIDMNEQWRHQGSDYLGMLGSPDYGNLVSPQEEMEDSGYINSPGSLPQSPLSPPADGYLLMRGSQSLSQSRGRNGSQQQAGPSTPLSAQVFSPRPGSQVFTFSPAPGLTSPGPSPGPAPAVTNPGYSALPLIEPSLADALQPSADNYVNVPQHRSRTHAPADKDPSPALAVENPGYVSGVLIA